MKNRKSCHQPPPRRFTKIPASVSAGASDRRARLDFDRPAGWEGCATAGFATCAKRLGRLSGTVLYLAAVLSPLWSLAAQGAAVPVSERLLPPDTVLVISAPDFTKVKELWARTPQGGLWQDEAMRPFREKFDSKWQEGILEPLERELDMKLGDLSSLPQGQVTFAMALKEAVGSEAPPPPATLLLVDCKEKSDLLRTNLALLRKKWAAAGKAIRSEKLRGLEFSVLPLSSSEVPETLKKLFPPVAQAQDPPSDEPNTPSPPAPEWIVGQAGSLFIAGDSLNMVDGVLARLTGDMLPCLGDNETFLADRQARFHEALAYGWVNVRAAMAYSKAKAARRKAQPDDPLVPLDSDKLLAASGLGAVKSASFSLQSAVEGTTFQVFLDAPEASRAGLLKLLAGEAKETAPPPFVAADVLKYARTRIDGQKTWAGLERLLKDTSAQSLSGLNFLLDAAETEAREKDPGFDIRKNLIGNLGDDIIICQRRLRAGNDAGPNSAASLYLIGSPAPQQLASAFKSVLAILSPQAGPATEREFLGRKIYSMPLPAMSLPGAEAGGPAPARNLQLAASGSYLALATDPTLLEEYLRSSENPPEPLREAAGFIEAMGRVTRPGTCFLGYENQVETMRATFASLRHDPGSLRDDPMNPLNQWLALAGHALDVRSLLDYSLLPPFEKVSKYFSFSVSAGSADVEGLGYQVFLPTPPGLRRSLAAGSSLPDHGSTNLPAQR